MASRYPTKIHMEHAARYQEPAPDKFVRPLLETESHPNLSTLSPWGGANSRSVCFELFWTPFFGGLVQLGSDSRDSRGRFGAAWRIWKVFRVSFGRSGWDDWLSLWRTQIELHTFALVRIDLY